MGKVSNEAKKKYFDKLKIYKSSIEQAAAREKGFLQQAAKGGDEAAYLQVSAAEENLNLVSYCVLLNSLSLSLMGVKNEAYLNDARKACYKALISLEDVVSNLVDSAFNEYEEKLNRISGMTDEARYKLLCKLGFSIQTVIEGFGENSKWKWSFVELDGRFATVAKNILDLKSFIGRMDPRIEGYKARMAHLKLVKDLLQRAADGYRQKYELSTHRIDDFKIALAYLSALRRIHILMSEVEEADKLKKNLEVWKTKMDSDLKKAEAVKK
ncbi:MAG: hypothetical protein LBQ61_08760 [Spirochaetales bacterium]|nr:hypothetical protein [Spirochaetales bacterium]